MADKTLASLTAATPATGGLIYGTQGGADRKFTLSAAGASVVEALTSAAQRTAMGVAIDTQIFTASGTWTKPAGAVSVDIVIIGGGAGGSSGQRGANGIARSGGGGGGPGKCIYMFAVSAAQFGTSEAVTVGAGGLGGASVTADDTAGIQGSPGGASTFGGWQAEGGTVGASAYSAAGTVSGSCLMGMANSMAAAASACGASAASNSTPAAQSSLVPTGGGGGGNLTSINVGSSGGAGGGYATTFLAHLYPGSPAGPAGGATSTTGTPGNGVDGGCRFLMSGTGGGGGGSAQPTAGGGVSANGGNGGNGGLYGGGGGGGSASENGFNSGAGGNGGDGVVIISTHLAP